MQNHLQVAAGSANPAPTEENILLPDMQGMHARELKMVDLAQQMKGHLIPQRVLGDGNCLARSVADLVPTKSHEQVCALAVAEVRANPDSYKAFVDDIEAWASNMAKLGAWADGVAVKATANALGVPIVVFRKLNPDQRPTVFLPSSFMAGDLDPLYVQLDETHAGCEHYDPLRVQSDLLRPVAAPLRGKRPYGKQSSPPKPSEVVDDWPALASESPKKLLSPKKVLSPKKSPAKSQKKSPTKLQRKNAIAAWSWSVDITVMVACFPQTKHACVSWMTIAPIGLRVRGSIDIYGYP